jgi:RHS repeat-associated protein
MLSKTRVWGSNEKILLHFRAVGRLSEKQRWGWAKCSEKIVVGSGVTYDYDAFGNLLHSTAAGIPPGGTTVTATPNEFLFAGEQFDSDLGLYYNRARYLNVSTGRFWSMDSFDGQPQSPSSLHKYLYSSGDPVNRIDPSGNDSIAEFDVASALSQTLNAISTFTLPSSSPTASRFVASLFIPPSVWQDLASLTPDAIEFGVGVSATVNTRIPVGITAGGGAELLISPKTGNYALYTYVGGGVTFGSTATSIGGGGTAGLVFRCPRSDNYGGEFFTLTAPMAALPANVRTKLAGDWLIAGLGQIFSKNGSVNIFVSPVPPYAFGVSVGVSASYSVGSATSNWALSFSYYWQDYPDRPVQFR